MANVTKEEIKKIAEMTKVSFQEDEFDDIVAQFNDVISYAERVVTIAEQGVDEISSQKNRNSFRPDVVVVTTKNSDILDQAPRSDDHYFVVPKFVDNE